MFMVTEAGVFRRVLIPIDGTRRSAAVVPYAIDFARRFASELRLVHVLRDSDQTPTAEPEVARAAQAPASNGMAVVDSCREQLEGEGLQATVDIRKGSPPDEILKAALEWRADVIAMATHSRRGVERLILGSVADHVVRESKLPVLLISS
jgi:nucleotide-binding universal stress UspA family protein